MGTFTFNVTKSTDTSGGVTVKATLDDSAIDRIAAHAASVYFPQGVEITPATDPKTYRAPTAEEVATALATGLANGMVANGDRYAKEQAQAAAVAAVSDSSVVIG